MDPFTLTTYNVHCFPWTSPAIHDIVAWIVMHSGTDLAALQEVWCRHDEWSTAFAAYGWTFARPAREAHIATLFGSGLVVAWPAAKWRLTDSRFYPFLEASGLDTLVSKGWFRVELQQVSTGAPLRLINTHMQSDYDLVGFKFRHITDIIRRRQVAQLIAVESAARLPTLVTGDMNTDNCWFPGKWLLRAGQTKPAITFPSTAECLDHCSALGPTADAWKVEGFHVSHIDMSDHYPVSWLLRTRSF
jgi:endonuclease/exonuclease/phosphatase family metal-dependent hydrolase